MKKKLLVLAMIAAMSLTLAACSDSDRNEDDEDESSSVSQQDNSDAGKDDDSKSEDTHGAEDTSTADDNSDADDNSTGDDNSNGDDNSTGGDSSSPLVDDNAGTYKGTGYHFSYDDSKWKNITDTTDGVECAFSYIGEGNILSGTASFNVVSQNLGIEIDADPETYIDLLDQTYESIGYVIDSTEAFTLNGADGAKAHMTITQDGLTMTLDQILFINDSQMIIISCGSEQSVFEDMQDEFDEVINTFTLD